MTPTKSKVWHVIYTRSRSEKKVLAELTASGITCFVPLQKKLWQWKNRKKIVEMPLLPGYLYILTGLKGELVKTHGKNRFILRIDSLGINFMLDISADGIVYSMD